MKGLSAREYDWAAQICLGASALLHALFLLALYKTPPPYSGISRDLLDTDNRFVKCMFDSIEPETGTSRPSRDVVAWPFGRETPYGLDPENELAAIPDRLLFMTFGYGGLGLRGINRGGTGTGLDNRGPVPIIRTGKPVVVGAIEAQVIRRIVHRHINEVKYCYEQQLEGQPDLAGDIEVKFVINAKGTVKKAVVTRSTLDEKKVERCISQAVRRWSFPKPKGGRRVVVELPIKLKMSPDPSARRP